MEELIKLQYKELKSRLDTEMNTAAQSFIRIGYLLRIARDTDALAGSGYTDVADFARAEYGLDRSQVSRFIRINERFGNGAALQERYEGFGSSKLSEMLMLPAQVAEDLPWEASKAEIRELAADLAEDEKKTSDLEIAMEEHSDESVWLQAFREYFHLRPAEYVMLAERMEGGYPTIAFMDIVAPKGIELKTIRLQGIGKVNVAFHGNRPVSLLKVRTGEREEKEVGLLVGELQDLFARVKKLSARGAWAMLYNEPFPAEEEENIRENAPEEPAAPAGPEAGKPAEAVAPVQQGSEPEDETPEEHEKAEEKPVPAKKATEAPKSAPKKQKVVDIVKPKKKDPEPKQRAEAEPEKAPAKTSGTPAPDFMNPPEPEEETVHKTTENAQEAPDIAHETSKNAHETSKNAQETSKNAQETSENAQDDPDSAQPATLHNVVLGEIRRCYRLLGESIEEAKWARARGFLSKLREYIDRIEAQETEEDKSQMSFEDFPELLPEKEEAAEG